MLSSLTAYIARRCDSTKFSSSCPWDVDTASLAMALRITTPLGGRRRYEPSFDRSQTCGRAVLPEEDLADLADEVRPLAAWFSST